MSLKNVNQVVKALAQHHTCNMERVFEALEACDGHVKTAHYILSHWTEFSQHKALCGQTVANGITKLDMPLMTAAEPSTDFELVWISLKLNTHLGCTESAPGTVRRLILGTAPASGQGASSVVHDKFRRCPSVPANLVISHIEFLSRSHPGAKRE